MQGENTYVCNWFSLTVISRLECVNHPVPWEGYEDTISNVMFLLAGSYMKVSEF